MFNHCAIPRTARAPTRYIGGPILLRATDMLMLDSPPTAQDKTFCDAAVRKTIEALKFGEFVRFDAHTMTGCCHGIALLAKDLINKSRLFDFEQFSRAAQGVFEENTLRIPEVLFELTIMYILASTSIHDPAKGIKLEGRGIRSIAPLSSKRVRKVVPRLQRWLSNRVAERYSQVADRTPDSVHVAEVPVHLWGRYVAPEFIRVDQRRRKYASSLYSMQVCLADLVYRRDPLIVVADLVSGSGECRGRVVKCLRGNGARGFERFEGLGIGGTDPGQPVVVIAGICHDPNGELETLAHELDAWSEQFCALVLAHHLDYPEFPKAPTEAFDSSRFEPEEPAIRGALEKHAVIKGVTPSDPSLFCITHVYPASVGEVVGGKLPGAVVTEFIGKGS